jgi:cytochrome c553
MTNKKMLVVALAAALISGGVQAAGDPAAGKEKAQQVCAACHGADGNSATADFPRLAGQHADYLASALQQYKSGKRKNAIMAGFVSTLSDKDMADLAAYFSLQSGLSIKY